MGHAEVSLSGGPAMSSVSLSSSEFSLAFCSLMSGSIVIPAKTVEQGSPSEAFGMSESSGTRGRKKRERTEEEMGNHHCKEPPSERNGVKLKSEGQMKVD